MAERKKSVKVPVILQMEALECGAASLAMVLAYYHKWVPLDQVRVQCGVSRDGSNALNMMKAAQSYGLQYKANRYSVAQLQEKCNYPAILFWNRNHFVVLTGFQKGYALINDPASGRVRVPMEEFEKAYSFLCLECTPTESFVADGKRKDALDYLRSGLEGNRRAIVLVMITAVLSAAAGILTPVFSRIFTDDLLSGNRASWYRGFILLFAAVILYHTVSSILNQILVRKTTGKLAAQSNTAFMWHLFRLPISFFSQRTVGDLAGRQAANDMVAATLVGQFAPTLMNLLMLVFYLFVMIQYSLPLTVIALGTIAVNLAVTQIISNKRTEIARTQMRDQSKLDATTVSGIRMVETIKAAGAENGFLERWSGYHASVIKAKVKFSNTNMFLGTLPNLLQQLSSILILVLGIWSIMKGHLTAGILLAFQSFMTAFMNPVNQLLQAGQSLQEMTSYIERIDDVMDYPEDSAQTETMNEEEMENVVKLSGRVEMKHVTFGYSRLAPPLIEDFSLTLNPGQRVAFVGGSGSGKSTIAKLLSGLYQPWSGEILFDGKPISEIPRPLFKGSMAMVDQDIVLFHDTVQNNIKMWDDTIEDYEMILAAKDAEIHDDILAMQDGYQHMLEEGGRDLSGGQRQRLEIARVLAGDPTIIILDEATSSLDARTEYDVSNYIHNRGITCIIVAHRLSTIRDCDEIIVMDYGKVVERGTHAQLMQADGLYKRLITTE